MNVLIQELKEKAVVEYPMGYDGVKYVFSPELFAELIVTETLRVIGATPSMTETVKKHFGIEVPEAKTQGIDLNDPSWRKILGLDRRVLTPAESAAFISKITSEDLAPLHSTNNQRSITEVYDIDGVKFHVNYLDEGEMIVEEIL